MAWSSAAEPAQPSLAVSMAPCREPAINPDAFNAAAAAAAATAAATLALPHAPDASTMAPSLLAGVIPGMPAVPRIPAPTDVRGQSAEQGGARVFLAVKMVRALLSAPLPDSGTAAIDSVVNELSTFHGTWHHAFSRCGWRGPAASLRFVPDLALCPALIP